MTDLADFDFLPLDADLDKFGWLPGDAEVSGPDPDEERSLRFNPNHGKDGKFSAGHGGGHPLATGAPLHAAGEVHTPASLAALRADVEAKGLTKGERWTFEADTPRSRREQKALDKTEQAERFLVRKTERPHVTENVEGDRSEHFASGVKVAETYPHPSGKGWVSLEHSNVIGAQPLVLDYKAREKALGSARDYARWRARDSTYSEYATPKDVHKYFAAEHAGTPPGPDSRGVHTTEYRLVVSENAHLPFDARPAETTVKP